MAATLCSQYLSLRTFLSCFICFLLQNTPSIPTNRLHSTAHHKTLTVRGIDLLQHTEPHATGQSEAGAVQDPGQLVERSEPHPSKQEHCAIWEMDLKLDKSINGSVGTS